MPGSESYSVLFDLYNTVVRFLDRFLVQRQLLAIIVVMVGAGLVASLLVDWGSRRYVAWYWRNRRWIRNERRHRKWYYQLVRAGAIVLRQVTFPVLALVALQITDRQFERLGWLNGLLTWAELVLGLYIIYRLLIAVLYIFVRRRTASRYHRRLFGPLMFVIVTLLILSRLTELGRVAQVVLINLFDNPVTIGALCLATVGLYFWINAIYGFEDVLKGIIVRGAHIHGGRVEASLTIMRYILIGVGVYAAMSVLGFDPTTVAAITGGLSIGIGFALQDVLKNFFGGLVLLFEGSVRPGDYVDVTGKEAVVQKLSIRSTLVRTSDNMEIIVPNQDWLVRPVTTYTGTNRRMRLRFPLTVKRNMEAGRVYQLLNDTARKHPLVLDDPGPSVSITGFNGSTVDYVMTLWVDDASKMGKVSSDIRLMLLKAVENAEVPLAG